MVGAHAGHNTTFGDKVILVNYASVGGHCVVGKGVFMSASVAVHQFCKIGDYCMVGGCSKISKDVPPFMMVQQDGFDVSVFGLNVVGLRRAGIESDDRTMIKRAYMMLYHKGLTVSKAIEAIKANDELMKNTYVLQMVEFLEKSDRGITRHHAK